MEFKDNRPIYLQIADQICEDIIIQKWSPANKIPSVRELAVEFTVNPHTVLRSYEYLEANNIIENKRGVGFFVAANGVEEIIKFRRNEFFREKLPQFFQTIDLLEIPISQIMPMYFAYKSGQ